MIDTATNKHLSPSISAYQQNYSTNHFLICSLEEWREGLDKSFVVRGALVYLSKNFDCIARDHFIVMSEAYNFETIRYIYSYLDNRK